MRPERDWIEGNCIYMGHVNCARLETDGNRDKYLTAQLTRTTVNECENLVCPSWVSRERSTTEVVNQTIENDRKMKDFPLSDRMNASMQDASDWMCGWTMIRRNRFYDIRWLDTNAKVSFLTWIGLTLIWRLLHPLVGTFDWSRSRMHVRRRRSVGCAWTAHVTARHCDRRRRQALQSIVDVFIVMISILRRLVDGQKAAWSSVVAWTRSRTLQKWSRLRRSSVVFMSSPVWTRLMENMMRIVDRLWRSVGLAQKLSRIRRLMMVVGRVPSSCRRRSRVRKIRAAAVILLIHGERMIVVRHHSLITNSLAQRLITF